MILCVNANAAIDKTAVVSPFRLDAIHRPQQVLALPGGKGCNVARALLLLGEKPVVTGWVGGFAGQFIEAGLQREGVQTAFVQIESESRTCLSILDPEANTMTELYEKGAEIPPDKLDALINLFRSRVGDAAAVTLSGSLPAGVPTDFYGQLIEIAHEANVPVYLDSSGAALKAGCLAKPTLIKPNQHEFAELVGVPLKSRADYISAALNVSAHFGTIVVLSLGAEGAIAADNTEVYHAQPAPIKVVSAVGSGDCLLAGVSYGLSHGFTLAESLRYGVAAGTANAMQIGAGIFSLKDFQTVLFGTSVTTV